MRTPKRTSLLVLLVLLGVFACALPAVPQIDQSAGGTAVALTVQAIIQQTRDAGVPVAVDVSDTPVTGEPQVLTATPQAPTPWPTFTPTVTLTPTAIFTVTPLTPMLSVSVPTNCRLGPGKAYKMVGALRTGVTVQIYGRSTAGDYWYIRNPDAPSDFCWVWGEYATVTGITAALPVFTPPPSPTPTFTSTPSPAFDAAYDDMGSCSGWWVDIALHNTGLVTFRSVSLTVKDTVTTTTVTHISDGFQQNTGCTSTNSRNALLPGKAFTESSPKFAYDLTGHKLRVTVTLCSNTGLNGTCVTDTLVFKP